LVTVSFPAPREVVFDYLADPSNRPAWQSSLVRVEDVDGEVRVGQTWVDVTKPGLRPRMETTELDRPHRWTETGTWHGVTATLALDFVDTAAGCDVTATVVAAWPLRLLAPYAVRGDLRHAASMLAA
jgi:uncharacterized protein YndB with AHSA1/START domain